MRDGVKALVFGSLDAVCDTSGLRLEAINRAFRECGMDWTWDADTFASLQRIPGGRHRLRWYAEHVIGGPIPMSLADRLHWREGRLLADLIGEGRCALRPGVLRLMDEAESADVALALVTGPSAVALDSIEAAFGDPFRLARFRLIVDQGEAVTAPESAIYLQALRALGCRPERAVVIEDTELFTRAANEAGVACIGTPTALSLGQDFTGARACVSHLGDPGLPAEHRSGTVVIDRGLVTLDRLDGVVRCPRRPSRSRA